jgi:cell division protein FtsL
VLRVNLVLVAIALASALGVVASQHKARKLFSETEREQERMRSLEVEWGQLQLEQSTWAAHGRVEKIARERLHMKPPAAGQVLAVEAAGSAAGPPQGGASQQMERAQHANRRHPLPGEGGRGEGQ